MTDDAHPIYRNALNAIQVGVEDFNEDSPARVASAVRSLTAGLLLLCKEKLRRLSPNDDLLIWKSLKPALDEDGRVYFRKSGQSTVDVHEIIERFGVCGITCNTKLLQRIAEVRNAVEHHYVDDVSRIRSAFVDGLTFLSQFMPEQLGTNPIDALGSEIWEELTQQKEIEDALRLECRSSYRDMVWPDLLRDTIERSGCPECHSPLVRQLDSHNTDPFSATWVCAACGYRRDAQEWVGQIVPELYSGEIFIAIKDGDEPPVANCPECNQEAFVYAASQCLACGFEFDGGGECSLCGEPLGLEDYGEAFCSYHRYVAERERDQ